MHMAKPTYARLENRGLLAVGGGDARTFLQGLVSNDVNRVAAGRAVYAAFLTAQGRYLHDFFISEAAGGLLLECEAARAADLERRLKLYRLRSRVAIEDRSAAFAVFAVFGDGAAEAFSLPDEAGRAAPLAGGVAYVDPRLAAAGARVVLPAGSGAPLAEAGCAPAPFAAFDAHRIALGLADGSRDLVPEKTLLLEAGFDELNGVDWQKGCYLGQELTARTKYRGLVKRRLVPVVIDGPAPAAGTPITKDGREVGEMRSTVAGMGLAFLRLEALAEPLTEGPLTAGDARLVPKKPAWAAL